MNEPLNNYDLQEQVEARRYYSKKENEDLFARIKKLSSGGGDINIHVTTSWRGNLRWARNRVISAGDVTNHTVQITRSIRGASASAVTNRFDDIGLERVIKVAERTIGFSAENLDSDEMPGRQEYLKPEIWSDRTYNLDAAQRSSIAYTNSRPAISNDLLAAGFLQVGVTAVAVLNTAGMDAYYVGTGARYSVTTRNKKGDGSGWAGSDHYDWDKLDTAAISDRSLDKCLKSANPKAVEPGRYTAILEPQAVYSLMLEAVYAMDRYSAENMQTVYTLEPGRSRIGLKVFDDRITISTNPEDPDCGYIPFDYSGYAYRPVKWVENGILKELSYGRPYALSQLGSEDPLPNPYSFRMEGGSASIEDMIAGTRRGLIVTRLSNVFMVDYSTLILSGVTRDGLWLVEDGKVTQSVKNFRFTESPMFVFNNVLQIGQPQRVLGYYPAIVPPVKVADFNFTTLADAV